MRLLRKTKLLCTGNFQRRPLDRVYEGGESNFFPQNIFEDLIPEKHIFQNSLR